MSMVNITIDGKAVQVPAGTTVLEAAKKGGNRYSYAVLFKRRKRDRRLQNVSCGNQGSESASGCMRISCC